MNSEDFTLRGFGKGLLLGPLYVGLGVASVVLETEIFRGSPVKQTSLDGVVQEQAMIDDVSVKDVDNEQLVRQFQNSSVLDSPEKQESTYQKIDAPYIDGFSKPGWCAGYATRVAKQLFDVDYNRDHAWNLRYNNEVIQDGNIDLDNLKPGDILGIFNPTSRHNTSVSGKTDRKGNPRKYTHVAVYMGEERLPSGESQHMMLHNYSNGPLVEPIDAFLNKSRCSLKEALRP